MNVYVAAPYADAALACALHERLAWAGFTPTSAWAENANGPEALDTLSTDEVRRMARDNDDAVHRAHVVIVLARDGAGGEMFAEARLALEYETPVIWVGTRRPLSAYRPGVLRVDTVEQALERLLDFANIVRRAWPVDDDWARDVIWHLVEDLSREENAHAA